jgi:[glutamine synthetase] adenylyltransferase / [glutamine synthetase]-adenylyl-L-tyrosine phosphorylase
MRVAVAGPFDPATATSGVKRRIAAAAALPDFEALQGAIAEAREAVKRAYAHALGGRGG